jgi:hypothetical protein
LMTFLKRFATESIAEWKSYMKKLQKKQKKGEDDVSPVFTDRRQ